MNLEEKEQLKIKILEKINQTEVEILELEELTQPYYPGKLDWKDQPDGCHQ